jgi:hypothetical protein
VWKEAVVASLPEGAIIQSCQSRQMVYGLRFETGGNVWTEFICLRKEPMVGCCDHGKKPSSSIKCGEFVDWLSDC